MADIADEASATIEQNLAANIAASTSYVRPKGLEPKGECLECGIEFEEGDDPRRLFCPAEPGERESDCIRRYNLRSKRYWT